jgi:hypothetical protein
MLPSGFVDGRLSVQSGDTATKKCYQSPNRNAAAVAKAVDYGCKGLEKLRAAP